MLGAPWPLSAGATAPHTNEKTVTVGTDQCYTKTTEQFKTSLQNDDASSRHASSGVKQGRIIRHTDPVRSDLVCVDGTGYQTRATFTSTKSSLKAARKVRSLVTGRLRRGRRFGIRIHRDTESQDLATFLESLAMHTPNGAVLDARPHGDSMVLLSSCPSSSSSLTTSSSSSSSSSASLHEATHVLHDAEQQIDNNSVEKDEKTDCVFGDAFGEPKRTDVEETPSSHRPGEIVSLTPTTPSRSMLRSPRPSRIPLPSRSSSPSRLSLPSRPSSPSRIPLPSRSSSPTPSISRAPGVVTSGMKRTVIRRSPSQIRSPSNLPRSRRSSITNTLARSRSSFRTFYSVKAADGAAPKRPSNLRHCVTADDLIQFTKEMERSYTRQARIERSALGGRNVSCVERKGLPAREDDKEEAPILEESNVDDDDGSSLTNQNDVNSQLDDEDAEWTDHSSVGSSEDGVSPTGSVVAALEASLKTLALPSSPLSQPTVPSQPRSVPKLSPPVRPLTPIPSPPVKPLASKPSPPVKPLASKPSPPVKPLATKLSPPVKPLATKLSPPVKPLAPEKPDALVVNPAPVPGVADNLTQLPTGRRPRRATVPMFGPQLTHSQSRHGREPGVVDPVELTHDAGWRSTAPPSPPLSTTTPALISNLGHANVLHSIASPTVGPIINVRPRDFGEQIPLTALLQDTVLSDQRSCASSTGSGSVDFDRRSVRTASSDGTDDTDDTDHSATSSRNSIYKSGKLSESVFNLFKSHSLRSSRQSNKDQMADWRSVGSHSSASSVNSDQWSNCSSTEAPLSTTSSTSSRKRTSISKLATSFLSYSGKALGSMFNLQQRRENKHWSEYGHGVAYGHRYNFYADPNTVASGRADCYVGPSGAMHSMAAALSSPALGPHMPRVPRGDAQILLTPDL